MARRKKPQDETPEQQIVRQEMEQVANVAMRGEKTAFSRKLKNMTSLIKKLQPIEQQIITLTAKKMPIMDRVAVLRQDMVDSCVHPIDHLVHKGDWLECKFCNRKIQIRKQNVAK